MKINNSTPSTAIPTGDSAKRTDKSAPPSSTPEKSTENVHLSSLSSQLQALEGKSVSGGVVDSVRVAEIKQAISNGSFVVNSNAVADHLIITVKDLIQSAKEKNS